MADIFIKILMANNDYVQYLTKLNFDRNLKLNQTNYNV
jgi:hypothetical protein